MTQLHWPLLAHPLQISSQTVQVVHVPLETDDGQLDRLKSILSPDESTRADRYKVPQPRRHFIACRAVLRLLLGECLNCSPAEVRFDYGSHGKPALRQPDGASPRIEFSVSHSSDQALIALTADRLIGVDIEQQDRAVRIHKLAQRFFSPREATELMRLPEADQQAGFFRGWTSKEAYLKATGFGLSFPLNKFSVSLDPYQPAQLLEVVDQPLELTRWRLLALSPPEGFAAAVMYEAASEEPELTVTSFDLNGYR
ncbi:MAG: 4'-phosphopantetheinyl transferase superfamily protein [Planctomycetaceae bacterium]